MTLAVVQNEPPHPVSIRVLRPDAVVRGPDTVVQVVEQSWRFR